MDWKCGIGTKNMIYRNWYPLFLRTDFKDFRRTKEWLGLVPNLSPNAFDESNRFKKILYWLTWVTLSSWMKVKSNGLFGEHLLKLGWLMLRWGSELVWSRHSNNWIRRWWKDASQAHMTIVMIMDRQDK